MRKLLTIFLLLLKVTLLFAQSSDKPTPLQALKGYVKNVQTFNTLLPQEKVYLHFDNTSYFIGEHIWFKAYVVSPAENKPTHMSKILYVELLNQQGAILQTKTLKIDEDGQCQGDFMLSDSLFSGFYEVRAYTRYMLNFDQGEKWYRFVELYSGMGYSPIGIYSFWRNYIKKFKNRFTAIDFAYLNYFQLSNYPFSRVFPVYSKPQTPGNYFYKNMVERSWTEQSYDSYLIQKVDSFHPNEIYRPKALNIDFFPEGGNLVVGIASRVAFKVTDQEGKELSIEGKIYDPQHNEVTGFNTSGRGMGVFGLTPQDTNTYTAKVVWENEMHEYAIPKACQEGCVLTLTPFTNDSSTLIQVEGNLQEPSSGVLGLSIQCRGQVLWFDTLTLKSGQVRTLRIPHSKLKTGVQQCTLFDAQGRIYADRLFFVNKEDIYPITLQASNLPSTLKPMDSIRLDFTLKGAEAKDLPVRLSVSVRDKATTEDTYHTDNIAVNLLLSSELKGFIPNPEALLSVNDRQHRYELDLLMMTQGWRRYKWEYMSGTKPFKLDEPAEKQFSLKGGVYGVLDKKKYNKSYGFQPDVKLNSYLEINKSEMLFGMDTTDKEGCFHFLLPDFYGTKKGFLEVNKPKKKKTLINKIFRKVEKFTPEHVFMIRHCEVLPKPSFSYYEKNTPFTSLNSTPNKEKKNKELELNTMVVEAKSSRKKGYPDFAKPDFTITGEQMWELFNDYNIEHSIIFKNYLEYHEGCQTNAGLPIFKIIAWAMGALNISLEDYEIYLDDGKEVVNAIGAHIMMITNSILKVESMSVYLMPSERKDFRYCSRAYVLLKIKNAAFSPTLIDTRKTEVQGFSYVSDFYHPKYPNGALRTIDDIRRTLYWNPDVTTDSTGKATIRFYNNSTCKKLDISAEGVTRSGKPFVFKGINSHTKVSE